MEQQNHNNIKLMSKWVDDWLKSVKMVLTCLYYQADICNKKIDYIRNSVTQNLKLDFLNSFLLHSFW